MESHDSFCDGLGVIYIASSRGRTFFDLTTKDMGFGLRYGLGKVLGTQNRPTLRLASHHCVLCLNPIKSILNIAILTYTHTNIYLTIKMASNIPNDLIIHLSCLLIKAYHTSNHAYHHIIDPNIHLAWYLLT